MSAVPKDLFPSPQGDLFGGVSEEPAYRPKPEHIVNRLTEMLAAMRGASTWPWDEVRIALNREHVWPHLLRLLPGDEAARWQADLDAEAARLDEAA